MRKQQEKRAEPQSCLADVITQRGRDWLARGLVAPIPESDTSCWYICSDIRDGPLLYALIIEQFLPKIWFGALNEAAWSHLARPGTYLRCWFDSFVLLRFPLFSPPPPLSCSSSSSFFFDNLPTVPNLLLLPLPSPLPALAHSQSNSAPCW